MGCRQSTRRKESKEMSRVQSIMRKRRKRRLWRTLPMNVRWDIKDYSDKKSDVQRISLDLLLYACSKQNFNLFKETIGNPEILQPIQYYVDNQLTNEKNVDICNCYLRRALLELRDEIANATGLCINIVDIIMEYNYKHPISWVSIEYIPY